MELINYPLMSEQINELLPALCKAQSNIPAPKKNKNGYGYSYADLANYLDAIRQPMLENNLAVTYVSDVHNDVTRLHCFLMHTSGQYFHAYLNLDKQGGKMLNDMQALGSGNTYLRRILLGNILNMSSEDDDGEKSGKSDDKLKSENPIATLVNLLKKNSIDVIAFSQYFNISSDKPQTVLDAVKNFDSLLKTFKEKHLK